VYEQRNESNPIQSNPIQSNPIQFTAHSGEPGPRERLITWLERQGFRQAEHAPRTILLNLPYGWACTEWCTDVAWPATIIITRNHCPEYLLDLWGRNPLTVLLDGHSALHELQAALTSPPGQRPVWSQTLTTPLTACERAVPPFLARGVPDKQIAEALGYSVRTVMNRTTHILQTFRLANRTQAALYYLGLWHMIDGFAGMEVKEE
jgi:DNA-binding CsgD family transcriptional regulator